MLIVYCSVPDEEVAKEISRSLVLEGLSACVNQIPSVKSYYIYEGKFCEDDELLLLIKTDAKHFKRVEQRIKELHPYELPEIIGTELSHASSEYASWVQKNLSTNT